MDTTCLYCIYSNRHYGRPPLCRVPGAHGKAPKAHGKPFAVCRTRQSTHGNQGSAKPAFAVCYISGTRQMICRVQLSTHGKKKSPPRNDDVARPLPCACRRGTWQSSNVCRVPWLWHTVNIGFFVVCHGFCTRQKSLILYFLFVYCVYGTPDNTNS